MRNGLAPYVENLGVGVDDEAAVRFRHIHSRHFHVSVGIHIPTVVHVVVLHVVMVLLRNLDRIIVAHVVQIGSYGHGGFHAIPRAIFAHIRAIVERVLAESLLHL